MIGGRESGIDSGKGSTETGTTNTTRGMTTNILLHYIREGVEAETGRGTDRHPYQEITHPRKEQEEEEMTGVLLLTTLFLLPHPEPRPAQKF